MADTLGDFPVVFLGTKADIFKTMSGSFRAVFVVTKVDIFKEVGRVVCGDKIRY